MDDRVRVTTELKFTLLWNVTKLMDNANRQWGFVFPYPKLSHKHYLRIASGLSIEMH